MRGHLFLFLDIFIFMRLTKFLYFQAYNAKLAFFDSGNAAGGLMIPPMGSVLQWAYTVYIYNILLPLSRFSVW